MQWRALLALAVVIAGFAALREVSRPPLTLVGPVTVDVVNGKQVLGGAVSYAAAVATAFGVRACVVTAARSGDVDLGFLERAHDLVLVPSNATLTFEHSYTFWGSKRRLRVSARPDVAVALVHVPPRCRRARALVLAPLAPGDTDVASFAASGPWGLAEEALASAASVVSLVARWRPVEALGLAEPLRELQRGLDSLDTLERCQRAVRGMGERLGGAWAGKMVAQARGVVPAVLEEAFEAARQRVSALLVPRPALGVMAQGLQRTLGAGGLVESLPAPASELMATLGPRTSVFLSDIETDAWVPGTLDALAARAARFVVTRGAEGSVEHLPGAAARSPPFEVPEVVDTNGAGDSFAAAYMLGLGLGHPRPAALANWAGGMVVTRPQACKPACVADALTQGWASRPAQQHRAKGGGATFWGGVASALSSLTNAQGARHKT